MRQSGIPQSNATAAGAARGHARPGATPASLATGAIRARYVAPSPAAVLAALVAVACTGGLADFDGDRGSVVQPRAVPEPAPPASASAAVRREELVRRVAPEGTVEHEAN
jgi:hypothetical protein